VQVRLAKLLEGRAYDAAVYAEPHAAEALDGMRIGDYLQLSLTHRFAILNLLINIALMGDMLRCAPRPSPGSTCAAYGRLAGRALECIPGVQHRPCGAHSGPPRPAQAAAERHVSATSAM
jgi:hypothetical protein